MSLANYEVMDVAIVGGGLAGLAAANYLARAGRKVTIFEKAPDIGGRAATHHYGDFLFNQGPHALYKNGAANKVLKELGIEYSGGSPKFGGLGLFNGKIYSLPTGPKSFMNSGFLSTGSKLHLTAWLTKVLITKPAIASNLTLREWLETELPQVEERRFIEAAARIFTYADAPEDMSAAAFCTQLYISFQGVLYIDGGWQTLVEGLKRAAEELGVTIATSSRVESIEEGRLVHMANGKTFAAACTLIAGISPDKVAALTGNQTIKIWNDSALPVRAACLDLGLRKLPNPDYGFAVGIDQPLYYSVHSKKAKLGPQIMVHALKYLSPHVETDAKTDEKEIEAMLDLIQPGWRAEVIERRFLPKMVVANAVVSARQNGFEGRPGPQVAGVPDLYIAGDWIGPEGMLLDASLASARQAAQLILGQPVNNEAKGKSELVAANAVR